MRSTSRLSTTVKSASRYLEGNTPTGLTGLPTHPAPRPALVYNYRTTLSKLTQLPPSSVYRQSVEALTQQRLKIVEDTIPEGYDAYLERVKKQIEDNPKAYSNLKTSDGSISYAALTVALSGPVPWDGTTRRQEAEDEGVNDLSGANRKISSAQGEIDAQVKAAKEGILPTIDDLEIEPPLTAEQYGFVPWPSIDWLICMTGSAPSRLRLVQA